LRQSSVSGWLPLLFNPNALMCEAFQVTDLIVPFHFCEVWFVFHWRFCWG